MNRSLYRTRIKFCGMTRAGDIRLAGELGVDAVGFIFAHGSPRRVAPAEARAMRQATAPMVDVVALFRNNSKEEVREVVRTVRPTLLQFHGSTLGILGMGRIGQGIARRGAHGFGMRVLYHNRSQLPAATEQALGARYVDFDTLLAQSDHLVLVLPYTKDSHHIVDAAALGKMRATATLVNIARGGIVDELALADALANGRLAGAGLDVYEGEPRVRPELLALNNVVLTPHIGSASLATRRAMVQLAVDNLIAALGKGPRAGHPPSALNAAAVAAAKRGGTGADAKKAGVTGTISTKR